MSRPFLRLAAPVVSLIAPASRLGRRARWERHRTALHRAVERKQFGRIETLLEQACSLLEEMAAWDSRVPGYFNLLGDLYHNEAGNNREAEVMYRRALEVAGNNSDAEACEESLNNLALLLLAQSKADGAEALLRRLLASLQESRGPEHPETVVCLENLSAALRQLGRNAEASEYRMQANEISRNTRSNN